MLSDSKTFKLQMLGANGQVTGSSTLVQTPDGLNILVDCGFVQNQSKKFEELYLFNGREFEFDIGDLDYVILTHSHSDHISRTPILTKDSKFKGKIISTVPTSEFAYINLPDSAYLMNEEIVRENKKRKKNKLEVIYTMEDAYNSIQYIRGYGYNQEIKLSENTTLSLKNAGHMIGAAMPLIVYKNGNEKKSILFTGDTSGKSKRHPFIDVADDIGEVDYIVCESTYGNRRHEKVDYIEILTRLINETCIKNKKTLLIPSFAIQRSSDILWLLREVYEKQNGKFDYIKIYLDTPMGVEAQKVVDKNRDFWCKKDLKRDNQLGNLFEWKQINFVSDAKYSKTLANGEVKILVSSSGMLSGGRVLHHLANFLPSKGCCVLFCGYQGIGTLGRKLMETTQKTINIEGRPVRLNANIEMMEFSSHADQVELINLLKTGSKIKKIIINHGDTEQSEGLALEIERQLKVETVIPKYKDIIKL